MFLNKLIKISPATRVSLKTSELHKKTMSSVPEQLKSIFRSAISSVEPRELIRKNVVAEDRHLLVKGRKYNLQKPCYVVGFGKAVLGMALEIETILGCHLQEGICSVPDGILKCFEFNPRYNSNSKIKFIEGAKDNLPDEKAVKAAIAIKTLAESLTEDDLLIVLISGGGSALLPLPRNEITLAEKLDLIKKLAGKGADIIELNCLRKKLSQLKGGGLAEIAHPAKVVSLVISDIIGDPLDFIASGPTTVNKESNKVALEVLEKYEIIDQVPRVIKEFLRREEGFKYENEMISNGNYVHVDNYVIGNNKIATLAAVNHAESLKFRCYLLSTSVQGDVSQISKIYTELAFQVALLHKNPTPECKESFNKFLQETSRLLGGSEMFDDINFDLENDLCFIVGGEPTVKLTGGGKGGRNQQLALQFSVEMGKRRKEIEGVEVWFLSCGTDGIDGPTDAAGAIGSGYLLADCVRKGIDIEQYVKNNDSYRFYESYDEGNFLVKVGHTGTNVMDIHILLIKSAKKQM